MNPKALISILGVLLLAFAHSQARTEYFNGSDFRGGYTIVPDVLPGDGSKVWVAVDVHGAGGLKNEHGGAWLAEALKPIPVIVIVPSFTTGYQSGSGKWAEQMIENFEDVRKKHPVHDKMFLHGHSGGAQFVHRFAFNHPKYVIGVSAHSAGSWACDGGYGTISTSARGIPFLISCGEKDTAYSVKGCPFTRIEWYRRFAGKMEKMNFVINPNIWPGAGHGVNRNLYLARLKECFLLGTQGVVPAGTGWKGDVEKLARAQKAKYGKPDGIGSRLPEPDLAAVRAANAAIESARIPDAAATLRFLARNPASGWAGMEEFAALRKHCRQTSIDYVKQRKESGKPLAGNALKKFQEATAGLKLDE